MKCGLAVLISLFVAGATRVCACSCLPAPPPEQAFAKAYGVFIGKVESLQPAGEHMLEVTLRVSEQWKGPKAAAHVVHTARDSAMCGYSFAIGREYLVYADKGDKGRDEDSAKLMASLCSRTAPAANATEDLRFLRKEAKPAAP